MKRGKKVLSSVLCLVLLCALAAPAWAKEADIVWLEKGVRAREIYCQEVQSGDPICVTYYDKVTGKSSMGYVDAKGKYVVPLAEVRKDSYFYYSEGLLPIVTWTSTGVPESCKYVDKKNKTVLTLEAGVWGRPFREGRAAVCKYDEFGNAKWGFIDKEGKAVTLYKYDEVGGFSNGVARVVSGNSTGYIDLEGQPASKLQSESDRKWEQVEDGLWHNYHDDDLEVRSISGDGDMAIILGFYQDEKGKRKQGYGFADMEGRIVVEPQYDIVGYFSEGLALVGMKDENSREIYGYIDKSGTMVVPMEYLHDTTVADGNNFKDGMALVAKRDAEGEVRCGWINTAGETVIPFEYSAAHAFYDGYAVVRDGQSYKDGKWGVIDTAGETVIPFEYDSMGGFSSGISYVSKGGKYGFINIKGEVVVPLEYDDNKDWFQNIIMEGYIGQVYDEANDRYGIFVNPESPLADTNPLGGLFSGNKTEGNKKTPVSSGETSVPSAASPSGVPVLPVVAAVAVVAVGGGLLLLKRKGR